MHGFCLNYFKGKTAVCLITLNGILKDILQYKPLHLVCELSEKHNYAYQISYPFNLSTKLDSNNYSFTFNTFVQKQ